jgi:amino acid transporter
MNADQGQGQHLKSGAIGFVPVLFQSITTIAPAGAAASGLLFATTYAGGSTALTIALAMLACVLVAISMGQMSKHLPSAGGLYTYVTHGVGPDLGFLTGWGLILAYAFVPALYWAFFGLLVTNELQSSVSSSIPDWSWAPIGVLLALLVGVLAYRGIGISAKAGVMFGLIEMTIFVALAITLIVKAGSHNTLTVFKPHTGNEHGFGSVFAGMIYTILAFIGFEAAAPIAEEAEHPRRNIGRAIVGSAVGVGIFYVLVYYAASVYVGPNKMVGFININDGDPFRHLGNQVWYGAGILVLLAVLNSIAASCNGSTNAASRMAYALGRVGILPKALAEVHPTHKTPARAVVLLVAGTTVLAVVLGFATSGPLDVFAMLGTALTVVFIPIYVLVAIASSLYFWRERRDEFNILLHIIVPLVAVCIFVPVEVASVGIDFGGLGIAPVTGEARNGLWIGLGWMVAGVIYLFYLRSADSGRVRSLGQVFTGEVSDETA